MILATRASLLALKQAERVKQKLETLGERVELLTVTTKGDRNRRSPLSEIGGDGLFIRALEEKLLSGEADLAVHSAKDLPYRLADGLFIAGIPEADAPEDCLLFRPSSAVRRIGTGSRRRQEEYRRLDPDAEFKELRGNINTRIEKLLEGSFDGIILAKAGLSRLRPDLSGLRIREFTAEEMIPAPCQGILAAECRTDDRRMMELLRKITDPEAERRFLLERDLFCRLKADCSMPVGIHADFMEEEVIFRVRFGDQRVTVRGKEDAAGELCERIASELLPGT